MRVICAVSQRLTEFLALAAQTRVTPTRSAMDSLVSEHVHACHDSSKIDAHAPTWTLGDGMTDQLESLFVVMIVAALRAASCCGCCRSPSPRWFCCSSVGS